MIVIGALVVIMLLLLFSNSMALQRFGLMEAFIIISVAVCSFIGLKESSKALKDGYDKAEMAQVGGLYAYMSNLESESDAEKIDLLYGELDGYLKNSLTEVYDEYDGSVYENAVLIQRNGDSYIVKSAAGDDGNFWSDNMELITGISNNAMMNGRIRSTDTDNATLYAIIDKGNMNASYSLVIQLSDDALNMRIQELRITYLKYAGVILAAATALIIFITFLQYREVKNMMRLMRKITDKKDLKDIAAERNGIRIRSNEMRLIYNGLCQVMADIMRINYTTNKALQIYYRFAPKNIERIMGKNSILDVEVNEQVKIEATLAYVSFNINERLEQHEQLEDINECYKSLVENRKRYGGIIFNSSTDLSTIQMMFNEENRSAVQFGIDLSSQMQTVDKKKGTFILLHRTSFIYGISGDEEQSFAFAHSIEMKTIEKYVDRLRKIGIKMAVTDCVHEMLDSNIRNRYIGYITDRDMQFKVYEILDAYPSGERQRRIDNIEKFNEALKLMYQSDFYFARTLFTEILKECPEDDVAKHYIFKCESCLNGDNDGNDDFSLF